MAINMGPAPLPVNPQTLAAEQIAAQQASQANGSQPIAAVSPMSPLNAFVQPQDNSPNGSGPIKIPNPFGGPGAPMQLPTVGAAPSYNDALAQALSQNGQNSANQNPNQFNAATAGLVGS